MKKLIPEEVVERKIFLLRGQKVMLSPHLAVLYGVTTSALIQAVRRNIERFPGDFVFMLTREEIMNLSQTVISSKFKHAPNIYAFTEQGVAMLSSVLRSKRAIQVNIIIMRAFVKLRQLLVTHKDLASKIDDLERKYSDHDVKIQAIFNAIKQLLETPKLDPPKPEEPKKRIGFHRN